MAAVGCHFSFRAALRHRERSTTGEHHNIVDFSAPAQEAAGPRGGGLQLVRVQMGWGGLTDALSAGPHAGVWRKLALAADGAAGAVCGGR